MSIISEDTRKVIPQTHDDDFFGLKKLNYNEYIKEHPIHNLVGIDLSTINSIDNKTVYPPNFSVDPQNDTPFPPELDDLVRLHQLIISRKVTTILEFGLGKSTVVMAHALLENKKRHQDKIKLLRRGNAFEIHSVENHQLWIDEVKKIFPEKFESLAHIHHCSLSMGEFNSRICTYYEDIPDLCPDFIYLDGPDQFSPKGSVRGLSTRHQDRMPMAADLLSIEHFLCPGTLIVVDGRTANARFLKCNFQRNWSHRYSKDYDQHFFELLEKPLGVYNKRQLDYCLGLPYYERLNALKSVS